MMYPAWMRARVGCAVTDLHLEASSPCGDAPTEGERYDFDLSDVGAGERGVSAVCGWCLGAVGSSGECENGCARHDRGQE